MATSIATEQMRAEFDLSSSSLPSGRQRLATEQEPDTETVPGREAPAEPFAPPSDPAGPGRAPSTRPERTVPSHPEPAPRIEPERRPRHC